MIVTYLYKIYIIVRRHFGPRVTVVFDGYNDCTRNIKAAEQRRRTSATSSSSDILFDEFMTVPTSQQKFLANTHNKSRFISMLKEKFTAENILVKQANNDADVLIIETAIEQFNFTNTTIVVGEDVDLLVLLAARTPTEKTIFFLNQEKLNINRKYIHRKVYLLLQSVKIMYYFYTQ